MAMKQLDLIGHSGFALECEQCVLVFDLFVDPTSVMDRVFSLDKPVVFFSSHSHFDHWSADWMDYRGPATSFVIDRSCFTADLPQRLRPDQRMTVVDPYQTLTMGTLFDGDAAQFAPGVEWIKTFGSTDLGVSFLVCVDDQLVFHAGDLNDWYWEDESTPEELRSYEMAFYRELQGVLDTMDDLAPRKMDLAYFPVDARLGKHAMRGALIFVNRLSPARLVPMHMTGDETLPDQLSDRLTQEGLTETDVLRLAQPGQSHVFQSTES